MGPITVFDKSFLQSLNLDESVWFDHFFYPIITPLFYIECLADLESSPKNGQSPEDHLSSLAAKTPQMAGTPCHFHQALCLNNLLGHPVPLKPHIPVANAIHVIKNGEIGTLLKEADESKAFRRWNKKQYTALERIYAREWRAQIARINLNQIRRDLFGAAQNADTKSLEKVNDLSDKLIYEFTKSSARFDSSLEILGVPNELKLQIKARWKQLKKPNLYQFSPYAAHILKVTIFFALAVSAGHISADRATNQVDIAYFFYAPFCHIFVSSDKLHERCAPFLLRKDQTFIWGQNLKSDLNNLDSYYKGLSDEIKNTGIYRFARSLPQSSNGIIREIFSAHSPNLLIEPPPIPTDLAKHKVLVDSVNEWVTAPAVKKLVINPAQESKAFVLERYVSPKRGSWIQVQVQEKNDSIT
ncbi:hypothetical protein [Polynucleobacter sp. HIN10]|jgi:hypothetical protein|uniref:hypothetical protein n=1 Tax=Polynucleobacter sp. HIN10 TaxID=3047869 RepID=UPI00257261DF|nr:hypothetical protein [Polynucleobacter sp. HIN10]BEI42158.1 hypothetical protein PHIN10_03070 [Polynucleobacter sp. HIN10]